MRIDRAGIFWNPTKAKGLEVAQRLYGLLSGYGCTVVSDDTLSARTGCEVFPAGRDPECDVMFVLGGDGTLLHALDTTIPYEIPMLGVNLGRMGFLTEVELSNLEGDLRRVFEGDFRYEDRMLMVAEGAEEQFYALNEVILSRKTANAGILSVELKASGTLIDRISGDGMIVASATGSTAYSMSAGGPIVAPGLDCFVLTPICAHTMNARPVVASAEEKITMRVIDKPDDACAVFDGRRTLNFSRENPGLTIRRSSRSARFIRLHERNYFELLREKLSQWTH